MARYTFLGAYQTNVGLPDGSVRLTEPGEVADLDFDDPGPLWATPTTGADALKGAALTKALTDAGLPKTGTADEKRAALAALSGAAASGAAALDVQPAAAAGVTESAPPASTEPVPASSAGMSVTEPTPPADTPPTTDPAAPATPEEGTK
jgi:hypothetical protein